MESSAIVLALVAVGVFLLGLWLGHWQGCAGAQTQLDEAKNEIKELRPKAEELAAAKQQLKNEEAKYTQMKADLDAAFKGAAGRCTTRQHRVVS